MKEIYINGSACISAQDHLSPDSFPNTAKPAPENHFRALEPSYKEYIPANMIRRMGRAIKMGISVAMNALAEAGVKNADAIVCGTGLGCYEDSEKFLLAMIDNGEQMLTPTSFIQSTHNTVAAQIALVLKCHEYNLSYVHRGFSFETALLDSAMLIGEGSARLVLMGGVDEVTPNYLTLMERANPSSGLKLGEGASFFVLSADKTASSSAKFCGVSFLYKPATLKELENGIARFLKTKGLQKEDISFVWLGHSSDERHETKTEKLRTGFFKNIPNSNFKQFCGEYMTNGAFAFWMAVWMLKNKKVPPVLDVQSLQPLQLNYILIVNHWRDSDYVFTLLSAC
ncbi:MAG TPA: beta-ketoacyl synthase chain length factor [Bacteroidia bacterium]|jgi:3-oxoacyl-(acyl-carrier-protein) synthase|nr:beta-ketoacyl synthase chain length factor [Bacteroidia bacterium]